MNYLLVIGMIAALGLIVPSYAHAIESTNISLIPFGDTVIDLSDPEYKRNMFVWAQFENFSLDDSFYTVQIITPEADEVVVQYDVFVKSTKTGYANFTSLVLFILTNNILHSGVEPGEYEMMVATQNGVSESIPVTIIDSDNS